MSDAVNPYQGPETAAVPIRPLAAQGLLTETMLIYLKGASPWLRFMGIMGFIGSGLAVLWGIVFVAIIPLVENIWTEAPGFEQFGRYWDTALEGGLVVLFVGFGALMFFPSLFVYRFGEKVRSYLRTGTERDLELAFKNNKSFWKFIGILCIVELAFVPLTIIGTIIAVIAMAFA